MSIGLLSAMDEQNTVGSERSYPWRAGDNNYPSSPFGGSARNVERSTVYNTVPHGRQAHHVVAGSKELELQYPGKKAEATRSITADHIRGPRTTLTILQNIHAHHTIQCIETG